MGGTWRCFGAFLFIHDTIGFLLFFNLLPLPRQVRATTNLRRVYFDNVMLPRGAVTLFFVPGTGKNIYPRTRRIIHGRHYDAVMRRSCGYLWHIHCWKGNWRRYLGYSQQYKLQSILYNSCNDMTHTLIVHNLAFLSAMLGKVREIAHSGCSDSLGAQGSSKQMPPWIWQSLQSGSQNGQFRIPESCPRTWGLGQKCLLECDWQSMVLTVNLVCSGSRAERRRTFRSESPHPAGHSFQCHC